MLFVNNTFHKFHVIHWVGMQLRTELEVFIIPFIHLLPLENQMLPSKIIFKWVSLSTPLGLQCAIYYISCIFLHFIINPITQIKSANYIIIIYISKIIHCTSCNLFIKRSCRIIFNSINCFSELFKQNESFENRVKFIFFWWAFYWGNGL